jgi:hypothetical protein
MAHGGVGIFEAQADEVAQAARARPVPLTDRLPFRLARADLAIERERQVSARP